MQEALRNASHSIYLESYIFLDDGVGREFVDILVAKAQQGVRVHLILDGLGSFWFSMQSVKRLQSAGAQVLSFQSLAFHRLLKSIRRLFHRNHRKTLIVDRRVGFIGGVNVRKEYADWLDLHLQIVGEAEVAPMVQSFARTWVLGGGLRRHVRELHRDTFEILKKKVRHIVYVFAHPYRRFRERSRVRHFYIEALRNAREHILIATPYFIPDPKLLRAFSDAIRRKVKIDLLVPLVVDVRILTIGMHAMFSRAHELGIKLHLLPTMMHGKAMIVDHKWGMVGSSNIDARSFFYNHEANIAFTNREMVDELARILRHWQSLAKPFDAVRWRRRSLWRKFLEKMAGALAPIL